MIAFTGVGSLPGTDFGAAARFVFDATDGYAWMPELPERGPWAALVGRGLGLPSGLSAELSVGEWRLCDAAGVDQRRARATWRDDLDQLEEIAADYDGGFKVAVAGPWTLAANLGVAHVGRVLADRGARRDLAQSLAESTAELLADVGRRLPKARLMLQIDEPSLPAVAAGAVPTPGGYFRHRAIDLPEIVAALTLVAATARPRANDVVLHSCAPWGGPGAAWPLDTLLRADLINAISLDSTLLTSADLDQLAQAAEVGNGLWLGVLPTIGDGVTTADQLTTLSLRLLDRLGVSEKNAVVITPACGLAGWTPPQVSQAMKALAITARRLAEEQGVSGGR